MDVTTNRLILHLVDAAQAQRIRDRTPGPDDSWAPDYPFAGDLIALSNHEQKGAFGYHQIRLLDGVAVGGIGFKGSSVDGVAEIGYGLVPSARGQGYASETVLGLIRRAAELGVIELRADTDLDNVASQRTLERAAFVRIGVDTELCHYARRVDGREPPVR